MSYPKWTMNKKNADSVVIHTQSDAKEGYKQVVHNAIVNNKYHRTFNKAELDWLKNSTNFDKISPKLREITMNAVGWYI